MMNNFKIKDPPEYSDEMRILETSDRARADVFNLLFETLINNDAFLKKILEKLKEKTTEHIEDEDLHVTVENKREWDSKAGTAEATPQKAGLESAADKKKLDGIKEGAEVNQDAYSNIKVGNVTITANDKTAIFTLEAGSNITLTADNATKKIVITANRDGGNADMVDGYHAAHFANADHGHDGRYYTKTESDSLLKQKAASSHSHSKSAITDFPTSMPPTAHTHDNRYYTETEVNNLLANKAALTHSHSDYALKSIYGNSGVSLERVGNVGARSIVLGAYAVTATGANSFATGYQTEVTGDTGAVFGYLNKASGLRSFVCGCNNIASGTEAFACGEWNKATGYINFVIGRYNLPRDINPNECLNDLFVVGHGNSDTVRSNVFRINNAGYVYCKGTYNSSGADYAEYYEWMDGNSDREDRVGHFVTLDGDKIRIAKADDTYILGVVSAFPCLIGNSDEEWQGRWKRDVFGRLVWKEVQVPITRMEEITEPILDKDGKETGEVHLIGTREVMTEELRTELQLDQVEGYDPTAVYIERKDRPEWAAIGMLGVLAVYDDGSCQVNGFCKVSNGGIATVADGEYMLVDGRIVRGYRVIERVAENIVKVVFR